MMRSLFSGISGLRNHQTRMDVIGNNVSNVNTTGFKASRTIFQDIFSQTLSGGMANTGESGGTNPTQVGLGIRLSTIDVMHTGAPFGRTDNPFDMMIENEGFFIVQDATGGHLFTRVGNFGLDSEGYLVTSEGMFVLGFGPTPEQIEFVPARAGAPGFQGQLYPGFVTNPANVRQVADPGNAAHWVGGNMPSAGTPNRADGFTNIPAEANLVLADINNPAHWDQDTWNPLAIVGGLPTVTDPNDPGLAETPPTAVLLDPLNPAHWTDGTLPSTVATATTDPALVGLTLANPNNPAHWMPGGHPVTGTPAAGFVRTQEEARQLVGTNPDGTPHADPNHGWLNSQPSIPAVVGGPASAEFPAQDLWDMENLQRIRLRVDGPGGPDDFADLLGFSVGNNGTISVVIDGRSVPIAQVALALFANNNGLERAGNSLWRETASSGEAVVTRPMEEGAGTINGGGLEMSNVDLASEFTDMIITQRGYQANSRIITVSDSLLEELVNLKR